MAARIQTLQQKVAQSEQLITLLKRQILTLKTSSSASHSKEEHALEAENKFLKERVSELRQRLVSLESANGVMQVPLPSEKNATPEQQPQKQQPKQQQQPKKEQQPKQQQQPKKEQQPKKDEKKKKEPQAKKGAAAVEKGKGGGGGGDEVDVSRLDLRIGQIVDVSPHPDADTLYVEKVNVGEESPRTIVSGLVKHVPLDAMQNRLAVFLCNLKPAKMRGILSEGMIMCASVGDKVEILEVPAGASPGDLVSVEGFARTPDAQLNPKKKIFEKLKPDLRTDANGFATFRGAKWTLDGKGHFKAPTATDGQIS